MSKSPNYKLIYIQDWVRKIIYSELGETDSEVTTGLHDGLAETLATNFHGTDP